MLIETIKQITLVHKIPNIIFDTTKHTRAVINYLCITTSCK